MSFTRVFQGPVLKCCYNLILLKPQVHANAILTTRAICTTITHYSKDPSGAKFITTASTTTTTAESEKQEPFLIRLVQKIPFLNPKKHRLGVCGFLLYESVADRVNYAEFFDEYSLPDTFYSWFVITELHVWMLMVRCMAEGDDGRVVRNSIVQAMWSDVSLRAKKLGANNPSEMRRQIQYLSEQFQAALIGYDEGLQGDDKVLAGAIWRRLYQMDQAEPEHLDSLVKYIRKNVRLLDHISSQQLFSSKKFSWESISKA